MTIYFLKLLLLLPLLGGMIWGSLWLTRKVQGTIAAGARKEVRAARLVETSMIGPGMRLAVIEFRGREILIGATRQGLVRLAENPLVDPQEGDAP